MTIAPRPPVPGSMSNAAYEQRLRDAVMDAAPLLNAKLLPVSVRSAALNKALAAGLPQLRDDLWRYADLKFLSSAALAPIAAPDNTANLEQQVAQQLPARLPGFIRLVYANGRLLPALSDECPDLAPLNAPLVPERTRHERFGWLNDAFAIDVARLNISGTQQLEILFVAQSGATAQAAHPRLELTLQAGAKLTLVERHLGTLGSEGVINAAVQIHAGAGSHCQHLRWQMLGDDAQLLDTAQIALDREARYDLHLLQLGGRSVRTSLRVSQYGAGSGLYLSGVSFANGKRTLDSSLLVDHIAAHTTSSQVLRAIARDRGHIALRSRVEVAQAAHGAGSDQSLKGLLGTAGAEIDLRPQLEIHTDQVRASHGATTGALDENMKFYLLSRGLDAVTAQSLLEWAFLEDAIRCVETPALRAAVEQTLAGALESRIAVEARQ
jgi:Fe-S cluster assembly protein SufD